MGLAQVGLYVSPQYIKVWIHQCDLLARKSSSHMTARDNRIARSSNRNDGRATLISTCYQSGRQGEGKDRMVTREYLSMNLDKDAKTVPAASMEDG